MDREILVLLIFLGILFVALIFTRDRKEPSGPEDEEENEPREPIEWGEEGEEEDSEDGSNFHFLIEEMTTSNGFYVKAESEVEKDSLEAQFWIRIGSGAFCLDEDQCAEFLEFMSVLNPFGIVERKTVRAVNTSTPIEITGAEDNMIVLSIDNWATTLPKQDFQEIIDFLGRVKEKIIVYPPTEE